VSLDDIHTYCIVLFIKFRVELSYQQFPFPYRSNKTVLWIGHYMLIAAHFSEINLQFCVLLSWHKLLREIMASHATKCIIVKCVVFITLMGRLLRYQELYFTQRSNILHSTLCSVTPKNAGQACFKSKAGSWRNRKKKRTFEKYIEVVMRKLKTWLSFLNSWSLFFYFVYWGWGWLTNLSMLGTSKNFNLSLSVFYVIFLEKT
jgi:hypothetical protein